MKLFEMLQGKFDNMSPEEAYAHAGIYGPSSKLENIIATDANFSYYYADRILHDKFPAGEKALARNPYYASMYAISEWVVGGPKQNQIYEVMAIGMSTKNIFILNK